MSTAADALSNYIRQHNLSLPVLREVVSVLVQSLMEMDVRQQVNAGKYERRASRRVYRNGYRDSTWHTSHGTLAIRVPKVRRGTYTPDFLDEPHATEHIWQTAWQAITADASLDIRDTLRQLVDALAIPADAHQIANVHAALYDCLQRHAGTLLHTERLYLDAIRADERGQSRYLGIAHDDETVIAYAVTRTLDQAFWNDFIRRLDQRSLRDVTYLPVSHLRHLIVLRHTDAAPLSHHAA